MTQAYIGEVPLNVKKGMPLNSLSVQQNRKEETMKQLNIILDVYHNDYIHFNEYFGILQKLLLLNPQRNKNFFSEIWRNLSNSGKLSKKTFRIYVSSILNQDDPPKEEIARPQSFFQKYPIMTKLDPNKSLCGKNSETFIDENNAKKDLKRNISMNEFFNRKHLNKKGSINEDKVFKKYKKSLNVLYH